MNNSVNSDKPKESEPNYNKKARNISKATTTKLLRLGLILIGVAALYFICHYIDQYIGNLVLK